MGNLLSDQFLPQPHWTIEDVPDLTGKIACVTGGYGGIGYEITKALVFHNAKVYIAGRSKSKADAALARLKKETGRNEVYFLPLDLADLSSVQSAAKTLTVQENRLDILFNNAAVFNPPSESKTAQGYELHWGVNVVGHFLFTKYLIPLLLRTAKMSSLSTRVVWITSNGHIHAPQGVIDFNDVNLTNDERGWKRYAQSKAGAILLSTRLYSDYDLLTFSVHPGTIKSDIARTSNFVLRWALDNIFMHPSHMGAITPMYAGTSLELNKPDSGTYFIPWARRGVALKGTQDVELAMRLWEFLDQDVKQYTL